MAHSHGFIFFMNRDIYLDGNHLECEGVIEMIKLLADKAEMEAIERAEKKEIADVQLKPSSAVSQMSSSSVQINGKTSQSAPNSAR